MWSTRMTAMEALNHLVGGGRDVGESNPGVLFGGQAFPAHEVLVTLAELAAIEDGLDSRGRGGVIGDLEGNGRSMRVEFGGIVIGLE